MAKTEEPLVSICMPSYKHAEYIEEAIDSIINQTYQNWELIVTDDASPDRSFEILETYAGLYPDKIFPLKNNINLGPSATTNLNILRAKGKYLAYLASDDRAYPDKLTLQVDYLENNPNVGGVFSRVNIINEQGVRVSASRFESIFSQNISNLKQQMLGGNFLNGITAMLRMDVVRFVGLYNDELRYVQDYDYWMRILDKFQLHRLDERLVDYRLHGANLSVNREDSEEFRARFETGIVILRALRRWQIDDIFLLDLEDANYSLVRAKCQLALARHCLDINKIYFAGAPIAHDMAASYLLDIIQDDPGNLEAKRLMAELQGTVRPGDTEIEYRPTSGGLLKSILHRSFKSLIS
jgi:glycosyltransferase involved in cell wall biosynthesis